MSNVRRPVPSPLRHTLILPVLCLSLLAGCDMASTMKESVVHAGPIEAEIERAAGVKPSVFSASTGPVLIVTVQFAEVPAKPVQALEAICRAAVVHEFKKQPTSLTLSFMFQSTPE
jgi:hypothetical protein